MGRRIFHVCPFHPVAEATTLEAGGALPSVSTQQAGNRLFYMQFMA